MHHRAAVHAMQRGTRRLQLGPVGKALGKFRGHQRQIPGGDHRPLGERLGQPGRQVG